MTLLIGYDDTPYGADAVELGLRLAALSDEPVVIGCAYPDDERGLLVAIQDRGWVREARAVAERKLAGARSIVGDRADVRYEPLGPASASRALHEYADRNGVTLLVLGSSERGAIGRISLGSTVERILYGAPCPVAVAPRGYRKRGRGTGAVAVAFDGSPESQQALDFGARLAQALSTDLRLVAVTDRYQSELQQVVDRAAAQLPVELRPQTSVIEDSDVVDVLSDLPDPQPAVLVCGSRGYGPAKQVLLGSVSSQLVRAAAYPVVVVPKGASAG